MGFGTEILFVCVLGVLLVGPKRLPAILGYLARTKAQLTKAINGLDSQLQEEVEAQGHNDEAGDSQKRVELQ